MIGILRAPHPFQLFIVAKFSCSDPHAYGAFSKFLVNGVEKERLEHVRAKIVDVACVEYLHLITFYW